MKYLRTFESFDNDSSPSASQLASDANFKKACNDIQSYIELEVIPNLTPEELQKFKAQAMEAANKLGVSKGEDAAKITANVLQKVEDKTGTSDVKSAVMSISGETNEGLANWLSDLFSSPKTKRFLSQLGVVLGIGATVAGVLMMTSSSAGSYAGGWSGSPFLTQVHNYTESVFGNAAGPVGAAMFFGGALGAFFSGIEASKQGDIARGQARRGASPQSF